MSEKLCKRKRGAKEGKERWEDRKVMKREGRWTEEDKIKYFVEIWWIREEVRNGSVLAKRANKRVENSVKEKIEEWTSDLENLTEIESEWY